MPDSQNASVIGTPSADLETRLIGAGLCTLSAAGFASLTILGKIAISAGINIPTLLGLRFGGAALILFAYLKFVRGQKILNGGHITLALFLLGAIIFTGGTVLYFDALRRIPASLISLLFYVYPIFVALFDWLLNRRSPTQREWAAIALASLGVFFTLQNSDPGGFVGDGAIDRIGVIMVIGSAAGYAIFILGSSRAIRHSDPWTATAWVTAGAAFSFSLFGIIDGTFDVHLIVSEGWLLLALILFSTILPTGTLLAGIRHVGPTPASLLSMLEPAFAVLMAVILLGDTFSLHQAMGGGLVLAAAILLAIPSNLLSIRR